MLTANVFNTGDIDFMLGSMQHGFGHAGFDCIVLTAPGLWHLRGGPMQLRQNRQSSTLSASRLCRCFHHPGNLISKAFIPGLNLHRYFGCSANDFKNCNVNSLVMRRRSSRLYQHPLVMINTRFQLFENRYRACYCPLIMPPFVSAIGGSFRAIRSSISATT